MLRTGVGGIRVLTPLALLMAEQGRAEEAETMLREHPRAEETTVRYALYQLLIRIDRRSEAAALRPPAGWPRDYGRVGGIQAARSRVPGIAAGVGNDSFAGIWRAGLAGSDGGAGSGHSGGTAGDTTAEPAATAATTPAAVPPPAMGGSGGGGW